jgi:site-specific DNA-cytosine methylase
VPEARRRSAGLTFGVLHIFCGVGGGALGFQRASEEWNGIPGRFVTLGGIDVDEDACADFERLVGLPATRLDLFSLADYTAFHGHEPPPGWREATPEDIRRASGGVRPDVIFASPPCKGFSALLPGERARSPRYEALNRLALRGLWLALEAWREDPPGLLILENVPRITSRGRHLLRQIRSLLAAYGYLVAESTHDMGEVGGLSQHRRRWLLVARQPAKVPHVLFEPPKRRVRSIGEAIGRLPMPDDPAGGPMHRLPRLQWRTWVRLSLIPAGGDWRDLRTLESGHWRVQPARCARFNHVLRVARWDEASGAVAGGAGPNQGAVAVADPRWHHGAYGVRPWGAPAATVTGGAAPSTGRQNVADPRLGCAPRNGAYQVMAWDGPSSTVTASGDVHAQGASAVADPRVPAPGVWVIVSEDGTWHRPLTTLELAVLQGFPATMADGSPLVLAGRSQARWRERIGNAVPPPAAEQIACAMLRCLIPASVGGWAWNVYMAAVWVSALRRRYQVAVRRDRA